MAIKDLEIVLGSITSYLNLAIEIGWVRNLLIKSIMEQKSLLIRVSQDNLLGIRIH